jgi:hypothetical protein
MIFLEIRAEKNIRTSLNSISEFLSIISTFVFLMCVKFGVRKLSRKVGDKPNLRRARDQKRYLSYTAEKARDLTVPCRMCMSKYEDPYVRKTWVKCCRLPSESDENKQFTVFIEGQSRTTLFS